MSIPIYTYDAVIVGAGLAGCAAARELQKAGKKVAVVTKLHPLRSHSGAAQGGINAAFSDADSVELHEFDTVKGSDYLADQDVVQFMCEKAPETIRWVERMGAAFSRNEDGTIAQRPFGGQSSPRACFAKDRTGLTLLQTIYEQAFREGVEFWDEWYVADLLYNEGKVYGVSAYNIRNSEKAIFNAKAVMFATGGYARAFKIPICTCNVCAVRKTPALSVIDCCSSSRSADTDSCPLLVNTQFISLIIRSASASVALCKEILSTSFTIVLPTKRPNNNASRTELAPRRFAP